MKRKVFYSCMLSASLILTLGSCNEDTNLFGQQEHNVMMTVNISRDEKTTRSVLTDEAGDLKCTWESTDHVLVVDKTGKKLGVLNLISGAGEESATFKGTLSTTAEGDEEVNFMYLGPASEEELKALGNPVTIDYSSQDGSLGWLMTHDFFSATRSVNFANSAVDVESLSLERQLAFGKFELSLPAGVTYGGEAIEVSGPGVYTAATVSLASGATTFTNPGTITITPVEGEVVSPEFYLTVLPTDEAITPTFTVNIDGKKYACTLPSRTWTSHEFVRKSNGDGTYSAVSLSMEEYNDLYGEYANEDPRNPLHKFSKYNLVRVGERGSLVNGFTGSETDNGALYQWGRNYGYMDTQGIYSGNGWVAPNEDFTNFVDALGLFDNPNSESARSLDYYVYNPNFQ